MAPSKFWIETHHLKGLFLSFQKIIIFDIGSTVGKLWLLKDVQLQPPSRLIEYDRNNLVMLRLGDDNITGYTGLTMCG